MSDLETDLKYDERFPARRKLIWFLIISFSLFALVFSIVEIENWRGRTEWKKFKGEWEAKGEKFDWQSFVPPSVPNESNFASIPLFAKLFDYYRDSSGKAVWRDTNALDEVPFKAEASSSINSPSPGNWVVAQKIDLNEWQEYYRQIALQENVADQFPIPDSPGNPAADVLLALSKNDNALSQLQEAAARPLSQFSIHYQENVLMALPHLARLKSATWPLRLRALAKLELGRTDESANDINLSLRLANSLRDEPILLSQLVRIAMVSIALQPLWEGLAGQQWSDNQLERFQRELRTFEFLKSYQFAMRGERAFNNFIIDRMRTNRSTSDWMISANPSSLKEQVKEVVEAIKYHSIPSGWFYQNQVVLSGLYQNSILSVDPASMRVFKKNPANVELGIGKLDGFFPYRMWAQMLFVNGASKFAFAQTAIDQAILACALERYRLAYGRFPETLAEVSPQFLEKTPHDIMNGEPLKYRRTADGKFILYSVGWNETNDGGTVAQTFSGRSNRPEEGDWVWQYSTNSAAQNPGASKPDSVFP